MLKSPLSWWSWKRPLGWDIRTSQQAVLSNITHIEQTSLRRIEFDFEMATNSDRLPRSPQLLPRSELPRYRGSRTQGRDSTASEQDGQIESRVDVFISTSWIEQTKVRYRFALDIFYHHLKVS